MGTTGDYFGSVFAEIDYPELDYTSGLLGNTTGSLPDFADDSNTYGEFSAMLALLCQIVSANTYYRRLFTSAQIAGPYTVYDSSTVTFSYGYQAAINCTTFPLDYPQSCFSFSGLPKYGWWAFGEADGTVYEWEPINHEKQVLHTNYHRATALHVRLNPGVIGSVNAGGLPPSAGMGNDPGRSNEWQNGTTDLVDPASGFAQNNYFFSWNHTADLPLLDETTGQVNTQPANIGYLIDFTLNEGQLGPWVNTIQQAIQANLYCHHGQELVSIGVFSRIEGTGELSGDNLYACSFSVDRANYEGDGWGVAEDVIKAGWFSWIYEEGYASKLIPILAYKQRFYAHYKAPQGIVYYLKKNVVANIELFRAPPAIAIQVPAMGAGDIPIVQRDVARYFP